MKDGLLGCAAPSPVTADRGSLAVSVAVCCPSLVCAAEVCDDVVVRRRPSSGHVASRDSLKLVKPSFRSCRCLRHVATRLRFPIAVHHHVVTM